MKAAKTLPDLVQQLLGVRNSRAGFHGIFIPVFLRSSLSEDPVSKLLPGENRVQNILHRPVYPASFSRYISLEKIGRTMQPVLQTLPLWVQVALAVVPALGAFFAGVGLFLNVRQSRRTDAQARASLVADCLKGFAEDEGIQKAFYALEYSKFKYDDGFHMSQQEREIDKLLRHFANIALAWQAGLLTINDVKPIQYYVRRVMRNAEIQKYLQFIEQLSTGANLGEHPYAVLIKLCHALEK